MTYQEILTDIQSLRDATNSAELDKIQGIKLCHHCEPLPNLNELSNKLNNIPVTSGWVTWPDQVQRIDEPTQLTFGHHHAPLEAELLLQNGQSLRLSYRDRQWLWTTIDIEWLDDRTAHQANALAEKMYLKSRQHEHQDLCYARIWQHDEATGTGIVNSDSVFIGFVGE